jgi:imidazolonepropionase-like amidohydrolase
MLLILKTRLISLVLPTVFPQHLLSRLRRRQKNALLAILSVAGLFTVSAVFAQPVALTNARIIDGTGAPVVFPGTLIMDQGRIVAVGASTDIQVPDGARIISLEGKTLMPGLINAHGHAGGVRGLETGHYSEENLLRQLALYASYGVTTVVSLGDDEEEGFQLRDNQNTADLDRARLFVAGPVLNPATVEQAVTLVDQTAALTPDFIKIRVDDNLGRSPKMPPEVYQAVSAQADVHGIPLSVHTFYQQDTKDLLRAGADHIAHSIRDSHVDEEFIGLMLERNICYTPTLTREVSTYIYESEPEFFSDAFFLAGVDAEVLTTLREPERQQRMAQNDAAQQYKAALPIAMTNLKLLSDAGVRIAMGTDSGPPARFQGYFEHLEMWMMQDAGITPMQIIKSATADAAACMNLSDTGSLLPGKWADLLVLSEDPLENIRNSRSIEQVWIAGNQLRRPRF